MPPNFFKVAQLAMMEKMQLTLKNSTEFQKLTSGQQNLVLERNSTLALYFTQAKLELAKVRTYFLSYFLYRKKLIYCLFKNSY